MDAFGLTLEMTVVLGVLAFTVFLFVSEIVRVDVAAVSIMVLLGLLSALPGLGNLVDIKHLFDGFASNAVISIIAVMIIGAGLDKTGAMSMVARWITRYGGKTESRLIALISGTVGFISSFMQNVGAAALFLPVVSRISVKTGLPMSRLLMPMGFCAILGGTMTMVGSSPLILLNDLILSINASLPTDKHMATYQLFDVTPIGLALVATGIIYFIVLGRFVLPGSKNDDGATSRTLLEYFEQIYGFDSGLHEIDVPKGSSIAGLALDELEVDYHVQIIATDFRGKTYLEPPRDVKIETPCRLAVIADRKSLQTFKEEFGLTEIKGLERFTDTLSPEVAGVAEIVIPPGSTLIGKTGRELWVRRKYGISNLAIHRGGETLSRDRHNVGTIPFQAGDTIISHTRWDALARLEKDRRNFVVVTSNYPKEELRPNKVMPALIFFLIALGLVLFSDLRLSLCLLVGAVGMILTKVLSIDEAYRSVGWNTVFLLASLIPLGQAVQSTGTAEWIAGQFLMLLDGMPIWTLQAAIAVLATIFTLIMSNVGATVLLVPLAVNIAAGAGADPALFALTVAISTSNSFLIPTHQVNALIMGPAGYKVADFVRAGGIMTVLFLVISQTVMNLFY